MVVLKTFWNFHPETWVVFLQFDLAHIFQMGWKKPPTRNNAWIEHERSKLPIVHKVGPYQFEVEFVLTPRIFGVK